MYSQTHADYPRDERNQEKQIPSSRLTDEKISDESGTEATADRPLAPAGLKNPFWN